MIALTVVTPVSVIVLDAQVKGGGAFNRSLLCFSVTLEAIELTWMRSTAAKLNLQTNVGVRHASDVWWVNYSGLWFPLEDLRCFLSNKH